MLDSQVKKQFKSWTAFAEFHKQNPTNFHRKIVQNIEKLNKWLEPANIEIQIVLKKQNRVGKNIKTDKSPE